MDQVADHGDETQRVVIEMSGEHEESVVESVDVMNADDELYGVVVVRVVTKV